MKFNKLKMKALRSIVNATQDEVLIQALNDIEERLPFYILKRANNSVVIHNPFVKALGTQDEYNQSIAEIITL